MTTMELEIYGALTRANVSDEDAKAVVVSIQHEIDKRYAAHSKALFTQADAGGIRTEISELRTEFGALRGDMRQLEGKLLGELGTMRGEIGNMKAEMIKWMVGTVLAASGLCVAIVKLVQ